MRVDLFTLPEVVTIRSGQNTIMWTAPTIVALKREVSLALARGNGLLDRMPLTDEHGELTTLKEWSNI